MTWHIVFDVVFYLIETLTWVLAYRLVPTCFFGVPAKPSKYRRAVFAVGTVGIVLYSILKKYGSAGLLPQGDAEAGYVVGGAASALWLFYWMFYLKEPSKIRRLIVLLATSTLVNTFTLLTSGLFAFVMQGGALWLKIVWVYLVQLVVLGAVCFLSWFSSRQRREPMRFSHILSIWLFCELLKTVFDILHTTEENDLPPVLMAVKSLMESAQGRNTVMLYAVNILFIVLLVLFLILIVRESESDYFQKKNALSEYYLETQKEHYDGLMQSNREIRRIRHDMKNHIYCLKELYDRKNYEELGRYLSAMDEVVQHADGSVHVGNEIADAIITEKRHKAEQKGITLSVDGNMSGVALAAIDVCTIFSNILDNAIEAVENLGDDEKNIQLEIRRNGNFLLISQSNPVREKPLIRENGIRTTKKDGASHGFGILNVREAAEKYGGECLLEVSDTGTGHAFTIQVMLALEQDGEQDEREKKREGE